MSSFLYRLGQLAARRRWRTVLIWVAAVFVIFAVGNALGGKLADDFNLPDSESQRAYDLLAERYPAASGTSAFIVFHATNGALEDQADAVGSTLDAIAGQPHVVSVTDPLKTQGAVSADGSIGYAQVAYDVSAVDLGTEPFTKLESAVDSGRSADLEAEIGGEYASWGSQPEPGSSELIGLLAAMIILLIAFGSVVAMGLPIGTAVIGLTTGTGLILIVSAFTSVPEFSTILSSMIGLGVGIDYALFIVTRYRQNLQAGMEPVACDRSRDRDRGSGGRVRRHHGGDRAARAVDLGDRVRRHDGHRRGDRRPRGRRRGHHAAAGAARVRGQRDRQPEHPPQAQAR